MTPCTLCLIAASLLALSGSAEQVVEEPKDIPLACDVDIVIAGDSSGAVQAACEAARCGARVFLAAPRPYLGTDICSTLRLWLEKDEQPGSRLALACFGDRRMATPLAIKAEMDKALLEAGVRYLTGCYATDVLRDRQGGIAGIVIANRSGRQAVRAKVVIDATHQATVARQAGAAFRPFRPGTQTFTRVVIGGPVRGGKNLSAETKGFVPARAAKGAEGRLPVHEYTIQIDLPDHGIGSFARAENLARDMTYDKAANVAAEVLGYLPSDTIIGEARIESWPGAELADLGAFLPNGIPRLYVLSACADLGGEAAEKALRPLELMELGARIGRAAADQARQLPPPDGAHLPEMPAAGRVPGTVRESLGGIGPATGGAIHSGLRALPVVGRYDVVVVGGGTSGAPAGMASAKSGAKTLIVEYLHELGGVGTAGLISAYWYGVRSGYTAHVDAQVNPGKSAWDPEAKAEWLRRELADCGAEVWFGVLACGALVDGEQVRGVVVATPEGRGVVLASTVIDATGNADLAAWAGAPTQYGISETGALNVQIAGFPQRPLGQSYVNTCYTMVDDSDVVDVWHLMVWKRMELKPESAFDVGQLVDSRERRRVVGDYTLTVEDILSRRTFPDTISHHYSNFDAAAFPDSPLLLVEDAKGPCFTADLPYRCLLPRGLEGILVVGLGASAERDAMTLIRMQPDLQNQGYAAGVAAAAAAASGGRTRRVDIKAIQKKLVAEGVLADHVLTDEDSHPLAAAKIDEAVRSAGDADQLARLAALAVVMAHRQEAIPLLKTRYLQSAAGKERLYYAKILGMIGDPTGAAALIDAIDARDRWDRGTALTSQRKTGNTFSDLDRLVIALGLSRAPEGTAPLLRKLKQLQSDGELSHYKALSLALWETRPAEAAEPLARLLKQPGFAGHATIEPVVAAQPAKGKSSQRPADRLITVDGEESANNANLNRAFKELIVAALLYRCGDEGGLAEAILKQYAGDIHGHFARYARWALERK